MKSFLPAKKPLETRFYWAVDPSILHFFHCPLSSLCGDIGNIFEFVTASGN